MYQVYEINYDDNYKNIIRNIKVHVSRFSIATLTLTTQ